MEDWVDLSGSLHPEGSLLLFSPMLLFYPHDLYKRDDDCKEEVDYSEITFLSLLWSSTVIVETEYELAIIIFHMINI